MKFNILKINEVILKNIDKELNEFDEYKNRLQHFRNILKENIQGINKDNIQSNICFLESKIKNFKNKSVKYYYLNDTVGIIQKFLSILKKPITISFLQPKTNNFKENMEKNKLINEFIKIIHPYKRYYENDIDIANLKRYETKVINKFICSNCKVTELHDKICHNCGYVSEFDINISSSYTDSKRICISTKYKYNRIIHFKECLAQYQGKENVVLPSKLIPDIEKALERNHLLVGDRNTSRKQRYKKIIKEHIYIFLKELGYSKYYDNINLIFSKITDRPLPDIGVIENKILNDFDKFTKLYDKKIQESPDIERKKNTQFILYQLLHKNKIKCKASSFGIPKTLKRSFHKDVISKYCFNQLGWNIVKIE